MGSSLTINTYTFYLDSYVRSGRGICRIRTKKVKITALTIGEAYNFVKKTYSDLMISMFWLNWN